MTDPTAFRHDFAADDTRSVAETAVKLVLFLGVAAALTLVSFVFLPLAALALAGWLAWRLMGGGVSALRVLALPFLALVAFAVLVPLLAVVALPVAGLALAAHLFWRGPAAAAPTVSTGARPGSPPRSEFDSFLTAREARIRYDIDGKATRL
jgi:hypothetical protein